MIYTAAVIGLGNIGLNYDYDHQAGERILTHCAGFDRHPGFELIAGVDSDAAARKRFEAKYGREAFPSVEELYRRHRPEVVSIGVPTAFHYEVFSKVIGFSPRAVLCEKPIADTVAAAREMQRLAAAAGTMVLINYMRRFDPGVLALKQRIASGELGAVYKGTAWYSKGIIHNGTHFIDLLIFLFGPVTDIRLIDKGLPAKADPEPDLMIKFGDTAVYFLAGREECFSIRDIELVSTRGRINYLRGGEEIVVYGTVPSATFPGYTVLDERGASIACDLSRYQLHVAEALYQSLNSGLAPASNAQTALETLAVAEKIKSFYMEG